MTDTAETDTGTEIITIPHKTDVPALFSDPKGIPNLLAQIKKEALSLATDPSTAKGRKEIKSLAAKVTRSKTLIDEVGKELNEERNRQNKEVNALRNMAKEFLDDLRDEIRAPAEAEEAKEAERVRQHLLRMDVFGLERADAHAHSKTLGLIIDEIEATTIDATWEEYEADAREAKAAALVKFRSDQEIAKGREDQEEELLKLRAEAEARAKADAERAAAEEAAKAEAEQKARIETLAKARADEAAAHAKAEAEAAEARHKQELAEAKAREEAAAQAERDRITAEQKRLDEEAAARAADKKHRQKIRAEIVTCITKAKPGNWEELVDMMIVGEIVHVKVIV